MPCRAVFLLIGCMGLLVFLTPASSPCWEGDEEYLEEETVAHRGDWGIEVSSVLPHRQFGRYGIANLSDGNMTSAWCKGVPGDGVGSWIRYRSSRLRRLRRIGIVVGYAKSREVFYANHRVKAVTIAISGREPIKASLRDTHEQQIIELPAGVETDNVKITIDAVYRGTKYRDLCISELELNPAGPVTVGRLMWQGKPSTNQMPWARARNYCSHLTYGGHQDWRLPNITELRSLIVGCSATRPGDACGATAQCKSWNQCWSHACRGCPADKGPAAGCYWPDALEGQCGWYWSSSVDEANNAKAWGVVFGYGSVTHNAKSDRGYTRCVRGRL